MFSPSEVSYVGALFNGETISQGGWTPLQSNDRAELIMSTSIVGTQPVSFLPTKSGYEEAHQNMMSTATQGTTPAFVNFTIEEVRAQEEAHAHIGATLGGWGAAAGIEYDFSNENIRSRFLIKFQQVYYSTDLDIPALPSDWLDHDWALPLNGNDLLPFNGTCPTYISSIKYGRMIYLMVESTATKDDTRTALNASFNGFGADFQYNSNHEHSEVFSEMNISALVIGGGASPAVELVNGVDALGNVLNEGSQFSATSPGAPIAFTLRSFSENSIVNFVTLSEFNVQECSVIGQIETVQIDSSIEHQFCPEPTVGDEEFGGECYVTGSITLVVENNQIWAKIDGLFDEPDQTEGDSGETQAELNPEIHKVHLYSAPFGYSLGGILLNDLETNFVHTDNDHQAHSVFFSNEGFMEEIIINGDTSGNDLGCNGEDDAYIRVRFKSFDVLLNPQ